MANEIDIAGLKELAEKATPGPWNTGKVKPLLVFSPNRQEAVADCAIFVSKTFDCDNAAQNAAYIAAASPDVVLVLIDRLERLGKELEYVTEEFLITNCTNSEDCNDYRDCTQCWRGTISKAVERKENGN